MIGPYPADASATCETAHLIKCTHRARTVNSGRSALKHPHHKQETPSKSSTTGMAAKPHPKRRRFWSLCRGRTDSTSPPPPRKTKGASTDQGALHVPLEWMPTPCDNLGTPSRHTRMSPRKSPAWRDSSQIPPPSPRKALFESKEWGASAQRSRLDLLRGGRRREARPADALPVPQHLKDLHIDRVRLKASKVIGAGQFGKVYRAAHKVDSATVIARAVKVVIGTPSQLKDAEFLREAEILASLVHPAITQLVGVNVEKRPWLAVLE